MLLFTGGVKSWSIVSALQDLGMIVVATGTEKSTEEDKARIRELMGPDAQMISDNDQMALIDVFHEFDADILIAGDRYIYPTLKSRIPFLDINHERDFGYDGYDGIVELARQLSFAVNSPVWRQCAPIDRGRAPRLSRRGGIGGDDGDDHPQPQSARSQSAEGQPADRRLAGLSWHGARYSADAWRARLHRVQQAVLRHFHEPIPLQTTAMDQVTTVLGADETSSRRCQPLRQNAPK